MDQSVLAGIGNILATEALWRARIDPRSRSDALSRADVGKLVRGLGTALRRELAVRESAEDGTSAAPPRRGQQLEDDWHDVFSVYGHAGAPCPRCGTPIASVVIGGRTTAFCTRCQVRRRQLLRSRRTPVVSVP